METPVKRQLGTWPLVGRCLVFTAVSSMLCYVVTGFLPRTYESRFSLLFPSASSQTFKIPGLSSDSSGSDDITSFAAKGVLSSPIVGSSPSSAKGLVLSRKCSQYVVKQLGLEGKWKLDENRSIKTLQDKIRAKVDDSGFLVVTVEGDDPALSKEAAATILKYLELESTQLTLNFSMRNRKSLEERVKASEQDSTEAMTALVATMRDHPLADPTEIKSAAGAALQKLAESRAAERAATNRFKSLQSSLERALSQGNSAATLSAAGMGSIGAGLTELSKSLHQRRVELEETRKLFTDASPEFKVAFARAKGAEAAVDRTVHEAQSSVRTGNFPALIDAKSELEALRGSVAVYDDALGQLTDMLKRSPDDAAKVKAAETRFQASIKNTEGLRTALDQAIVAESRDPARFEVVDEPVEDRQAVSPRRGLITGAWVALCLAACGWLVVRRFVKFVD